MRNYFSKFLSIAACASIAAFAAMLSGCGGGEPTLDTIDIPVTVTLKGSPLADCTVEFHPHSEPGEQEDTMAKTKLAFGVTDAEGKVILKVAKGKYKVAFRRNDKPVGEADMDMQTKGAKGTKTEGQQSETSNVASQMGAKGTKSLINEKYNNPDPKSTGFDPFVVDDARKETGFTFDLGD